MERAVDVFRTPPTTGRIVDRVVLCFRDGSI